MIILITTQLQMIFRRKSVYQRVLYIYVHIQELKCNNKHTDFPIFHGKFSVISYETCIKKIKYAPITQFFYSKEEQIHTL